MDLYVLSLVLSMRFEFYIIHLYYFGSHNKQYFFHIGKQSGYLTVGEQLNELQQNYYAIIFNRVLCNTGRYSCYDLDEKSRM